LRAGTLTTHVKITKVAHAGGMIIQNFDFEVQCVGRPVYRGDTYFGFFTKQALSQQVGMREAKAYDPSPEEQARGQQFLYPTQSPSPDSQLRIIDSIDLFGPDGGPHGLGFIRGSKRVDPDEWFFKAHFFQDPVCPGSLGLESFLQLLKVVAGRRWGAKSDCQFEVLSPNLHQGSAQGDVWARPHRWTYRGQVLPTNKKVTVQASITAMDDVHHRLQADGFLRVDGLVIYQMNDFTLGMRMGTP